MAQRKRRKPWNADLKIPGITDSGPGTAPAPSPDTMHVGHSTGAHFEEPRWVCGRCDQIRGGLNVTVPDHHLQCVYRGLGRDPDPSG